MNFGQALEALRTGECIARDGWNGRGMWLALASEADVLLVAARAQVVRSQPFILMRTAQGTFVPWLASQTDVLAEDWRIAVATHDELPRETGWGG